MNTDVELVIGNLNSGRSKRGVDAVRRTMADWRDKALEVAGNRPIMLFTEEMDEGDKTRPSDHSLLKQVFRPFRRIHMSTRTPILLLGFKGRGAKISPVVGVHRSKKFRGVPRQSPHRSVVEIRPRKEAGFRYWTKERRATPDIVGMGGHFPAGSRNGHRRPAVKVLLDALYDAMLVVWRGRIAYHHARGRHVVIGTDGNNRRMPRLHPNAVRIMAHPPDYLDVVPAKGYRVRVTGRWLTKNHFEGFHAGMVARIKFEKKG